MLNVSDKSVSKWENGGMPGIDLLPKLSKIFNVSIDYLLMGEGDDTIEIPEEPVKKNNEVNSIVKSFSVDEELKILQGRYNEEKYEKGEKKGGYDGYKYDNYKKEDNSDNVGCWAYILAFLFPLVGFIIGLVYKSRGLIILSVLLMLLEPTLIMIIFGTSVFSALSGSILSVL